MAYIAKIRVDNVDVDVQEAYDDLWADEQRNFLLENIGDLKDEDLIDELCNRGYQEPNKPNPILG